MLEYEIGDVITIFDPPVDWRQEVTEELTLPNPAFAQAEIYSPYAHVAIPKYNYYYNYDPGRNTLEIPRGCPIEGKCIRDNRISVEVNYPPFRLELRGTQQEAVDAYLTEGREDRDGLFVLPTGKGKSILFIYLAFLLKQKALIIVHKDDLVDGWKKDIQLCLGLRPKQVGLIKAGVFRIGEQITITTIQTLSKLPSEKQEMLFREFGMLGVDELHHVGASTYDFTSKFFARDRIGLTATDMRNDGLGAVMNFYFGSTCFRFVEQKDADDEDIISAKDVIVKVKPSSIYFNPRDVYLEAGTNRVIEMIKWGDGIVNLHDLPDEDIQYLLHEGFIKKKPMDYHRIKLLISRDENFNHLVCSDIVTDYKAGKSILCFCSLKDHCRTVHSILIDMGIPENKIQLYYGDNKSTSKSVMKKRAESEEVMVTIATYAIATEGTNVKRWDSIFLAATFNNEKDTIQAVGRGRRRTPTKSQLIVHDYSHPNVKGIRRHINTRVRVYKKLGFTFFVNKSQKFTYGKGFANSARPY